MESFCYVMVIFADPFTPLLSPLSDSQNKAIRVLIAEDDADDRELLREVIHEIGRNVVATFVANGEELIHYLNVILGLKPELLPSLIVLDVNMPKMNGREAIQLLHSDDMLNSIPIVTLTTSNDARLKQEMEKLGACGFYTKPTCMD